MRKQFAFVIGVPFLTVLAGCCNLCDKKPASSPTEPSSTTPAAVAAQEATNPDAPLACAAKQDEAPDAKRVTAGTYCVCDAGPPNEGLHPTTNEKGEHMRMGDPVVIGTLGDATSVKLGENDLRFDSTGDGRGLSALVAYPHVDAPAGVSEKKVKHLINITKYRHPVGGEPPGSCDVTKNIVKVTYCYWANETDVQEWKCATTRAGHLGDIHAQN